MIHHNRQFAALCLARAGKLRRRQLGYPCRSWSECVEVKHLIRRARLARLTGAGVYPVPSFLP